MGISYSCDCCGKDILGGPKGMKALQLHVINMDGSEEDYIARHRIFCSGCWPNKLANVQTELDRSH